MGLIKKSVFILVLAMAVCCWNGDIKQTQERGFTQVAEAVIGRPATPISYAGVARRTTVRVASRGVGAQPANRGGPVNRVGRR